MNELTYILGAGASYQSIPVVKTFAKRFRDFNDIVLYRFSNSGNTYLGNAYSFGQTLVKAFETHQSFDTYFKKLFHNNNLSEIKEAKEILNLYFYWEHLSETKSKPTTPIDDLPFWKESKLDKRYDALIAGLLQPVSGKLKVFCKTNFITWNYDLNLFSSLKNYFKPESTVKEFLDDITDKKNKNLWKIDDQIEVINMNGFFYSSKFDEFINLPDYELPDFNTNGLDRFREQFDDKFCESALKSDAEKIKFAWENGFDISKIAKSKIYDSKNVVIIGYTFPLYNRLSDLNYIDKDSSDYYFNQSKKITIQDPNAENIASTLIEFLEKPDSYRNLINIKPDCDYFYIPSNIFGAKEFNKGGYETILINS